MSASDITPARSANPVSAPASAATQPADTASWRTPVELTLLGAVWGGSFLFMRVAAADFGPSRLLRCGWHSGRSS